MTPLGVTRLDDNRWRFNVWALNAESVELRLLDDDRTLPMTRDKRGYFSVIADDVQAGARYVYRIDGEKERPDMTSRSQPDGVHGASEIADLRFDWTDGGFTPPSLRNSVFYELHVGTFTPEGTFEAIIPHLQRLREYGITTLSLMPVAQFPGKRNWGYDGVGLYAPQNSYGGVRGLQRLVNAAHNAGLAVYLDAVYNHLGPEGNYLWDYAPYFTDHYKTPWGDSLNFDGAWSDEVQRFFIENALYWLEHYHIDGFRLDATHALYDFSAVPFLTKLAAAIQDWGERNNKRVHVIAENDTSNRKHLLPRESGGTGLDGQWLDDLHHAMHTLLTGENTGYYADYGQFEHLVKCLREGYIYSGQWAPNRKRTVGTSSADIPADRFIVASQTHDQVGNRMLGDRLHHLVSWDAAKLAAGTLLLSPYAPMIFMGEEYAEAAPFLYFTSHSDPTLVEGVRQGRIDEFADFQWAGEPPDPQADETFQHSKLDHALRNSGKHAVMYHFYGELLKLRHTRPALTNPDRSATSVLADARQQALWMIRKDGDDLIAAAFNWHPEREASLNMPVTGKSLREIFNSNDPQWRITREAQPRPLGIHGGTDGIITLPPHAFIVYASIRNED